MFIDFFKGIPTTGGKIRVSKTLMNNLLSKGIKILDGWDWETVG